MAAAARSRFRRHPSTTAAASVSETVPPGSTQENSHEDQDQHPCRLGRQQHRYFDHQLGWGELGRREWRRQQEAGSAAARLLQPLRRYLKQSHQVQLRRTLMNIKTNIRAGSGGSSTDTSTSTSSGGTNSGGVNSGK